MTTPPAAVAVQPGGAEGAHQELTAFSGSCRLGFCTEGSPAGRELQSQDASRDFGERFLRFQIAKGLGLG